MNYILTVLLVPICWLGAEAFNPHKLHLTVCDEPLLYIKQSNSSGQKTFRISRGETSYTDDGEPYITAVCMVRHVTEGNHLINMTIFVNNSQVVTYNRQTGSLNYPDDTPALAFRHDPIAGFFHHIEVDWPCSLDCHDSSSLQSCLVDDWRCEYHQAVVDAEDQDMVECSNTTGRKFECQDPWFELAAAFFHGTSERPSSLISDHIVLFSGSKTKLTAHLHHVPLDFNAYFISLTTNDIQINIGNAIDQHNLGTGCGRGLTSSFIIEGQLQAGHSGARRINMTLSYDLTHGGTIPGVSSMAFLRTIVADIYSVDSMHEDPIALEWYPEDSANLWTDQVRLKASIAGQGAEGVTWVFWRKDLYVTIENGRLLQDDSFYHALGGGDVKEINEESIVVNGEEISFEFSPSACGFLPDPGETDGSLHLPLIKELRILVYTGGSGMHLQKAWLQFYNWTFDDSHQISVDNNILSGEEHVIANGIQTKVHHFVCHSWCPLPDTSILLQFVNRRITAASTLDARVHKRNFSTRKSEWQCGYKTDQIIPYPNVLYDGIFIGTCFARCGGVVGKNIRFSLKVNENVCSPNPCQNGGACVAVGSHYICSCPDIYEGTRCELYRQCQDNMCENGGTCLFTTLENGSVGQKCFCEYPHFSDVCHREIEREYLFVCTDHIVCAVLLSVFSVLIVVSGILTADFLVGKRLCFKARTPPKLAYNDPYQRYDKVLANAERNEQFYDDLVYNQRELLLVMAEKVKAAEDLEEAKNKEKNEKKKKGGNDNKKNQKNIKEKNKTD